ncbi:MAG: hypothetical protein CR979_00805 [Propionibacterium sp.]|nr:MAG: hypothetical protein CR979_00805 [Propionibacterium sp.]
MSKHKAERPVERTVTLAILIIGTVVSVALAFGTDWTVRIGLGVAIAMAFTSAIMSWRELDRVSEAYRLELKAVLAANMEQADRHHRDSLELIDRYDAHADQLRAMIRKINTQLGSAHAELAAMRGNSVWLRGEIAERQARIEVLEKRVAELQSMQSKGDSDTNLLSLPRYGVSSGQDPLPTAEELWADGDYPTIVDLALVAFSPDEVEERKQA